jgi:hypothetical protein
LIAENSPRVPQTLSWNEEKRTLRSENFETPTSDREYPLHRSVTFCA